MKLFISGYLQVFFVVMNTYFISKGFIFGIMLASFIISLIWSWNVKKIAFGTNRDRLIYSIGAMVGSLASFYFSKLIFQLIFKF